MKVWAQSAVLPAVTVCSAEPYKTKGFHFNETAFANSTYGFNEIFYNTAKDLLKEKERLYYKFI